MSVLLDSRSPFWRYELLDKDGKFLYDLDTVTGGTVTVSADGKLGSSGTIELDASKRQINWLSDKLRIWYEPGVEGVTAWPVGTFSFTSPTETFTDGHVSYSAGLVSPLAQVDTYSLQAREVAAKLTNIAGHVSSLLFRARIGVENQQVTFGSAVMPYEMSWEAGTSTLTVCNELLALAGYEPLFCDEWGRICVVPQRVNYRKSTPAWVFTHGDTAIYKTGWKRTQPLSSVPNRAVVVGRGDSDTPAKVGVALNSDKNSIFSTVSRGVVVTVSQTGFDGVDQEAVNLRARALLLEKMKVATTFNVVHAPVPVSVNSVINFSPLGIDTVVPCVVSSMKFSLSDASLCEAEWTEVVEVSNA